MLSVLKVEVGMFVSCASITGNDKTEVVTWSTVTTSPIHIIPSKLVDIISKSDKAGQVLFRLATLRVPYT